MAIKCPNNPDFEFILQIAENQRDDAMVLAGNLFVEKQRLGQQVDVLLGDIKKLQQEIAESNPKKIKKQ